MTAIAAPAHIPRDECVVLECDNENDAKHVFDKLREVTFSVDVHLTLDKHLVRMDTPVYIQVLPKGDIEIIENIAKTVEAKVIE